MADIPSIWELDYCDLTLYQHPPCMFTLWYLGLAVNAAWDPVKDLINRISECLSGDGGGGGGGSGGEGSSDKDKKADKGGEGEQEGEAAKEEPAEEAPAEEEPAEEEAEEEEG